MTANRLPARVIKRTQGGKKFVGTVKHIRAELDRLARQVRKELRGVHANTIVFKKSKEPQDYILYERGLAAEASLKDVLNMIQQAKQ